MLSITALLILSFTAQHVVAVTNCGIGTDPFFQTVSYNPKQEMWHASAIIFEYNEKNDTEHVDYQQHWETRTIDKQCILTRAFYMIFDENVYIHQQKIFPAENGVYRYKEYNPYLETFEDVDIRAYRESSTVVSIISDVADQQQMIVDVPHQSFRTVAKAPQLDTYITFNVLQPSQQNEKVKMARNAYESGKEMLITDDPIACLVFRV